MKKVLTTLLLLTFSYLTFSQTIDEARLKLCVGKATTLLIQYENFDIDKKNPNPKAAINYNTEEFKKVWLKLRAKTNNLKTIKPNQEYKIVLNNEDIEEWTIKLMPNSVVSMQYSFNMGRTLNRDCNFIYNLNDGTYTADFNTQYGNHDATFTSLKIKNDIIIKKESEK